MNPGLTITSAGVTFRAEFYENETARQIHSILPLEAVASRWGDEIYFSIPLQLKQAADARTEMKIGELAYWPAGNAFCIFWGPTPASLDETPVAASAVNPFGMIKDDVRGLGSIEDGAVIRIARG